MAPDTPRRPRVLSAPGLLVAGMALVGGSAAEAGPLAGKTYVLEVTSSASTSGYGDQLLPALIGVLEKSELGVSKGPGADLVINIVARSDTGQWIGQGAGRAWTYTVRMTIGISPETTSLSPDGTPVFGVTAILLTPDSDRGDELACLVRLAARTALASYRPQGAFQTDGQSCLRRQP